jgi:Xaa-Pro aminopeptidase
VRGEILHNTSYANVVKSGDMILIDCGGESGQGYCADITRTYSSTGDHVGFSQVQRGVYDVVLRAQRVAIERTALRGASQVDVHLSACRELTIGLQELGLMRGDPDESVQAGAHALFMPHGIGHMLGLDVHDMENLGDEMWGMRLGRVDLSNLVCMH